MAMGDIIGFWGTLFMVIITAMIGANLARNQGISVLLSAQATVAQGKTPVKEIYSGICILIAGALLITPGFLTDGVGILLLIPAFRSILGFYLADKIINHVKMSSFNTGGFSTGGFNSQYSQKNDDIIDGDFQTVDKNQKSDSKNTTIDHKD